MGAAPRLRRVTPAARESEPASREDRQGEALERPGETIETAARLLAVLGHDISNQLTAVINYGFLLARGLEANPALREYAEEMQRAAWRASHLTQVLRVVAPARSSRPETVDLHRAIEAARPLLERVSSPAELDLQPRATHASILAIRTDVDQILFALAVHARGALARGGCWRLRAQALNDERGCFVRLSCTLNAQPRLPDEGQSRITVGAPPPRGDLLRAALRRCRARLSRQGNTVRVDFPVSA